MSEPSQLLQLNLLMSRGFLISGTVAVTKMGDDLDQIDDLGDICDILRSLNISTKGLNEREMKAELRHYLEESATKRVCEVSILIFSDHRSMKQIT